MTVLRVLVCVCFVAVLSFAAGGADGALQFHWRGHTSNPNLAKDLAPTWEGVFKAILQSIEDDEFRKDVQEKIADGVRREKTSEVISYCDLSIVECNKYDIVKMTLRGMEGGKLNLAYLPDTLQSLEVSDSTLAQEFRVENLSPNLETIVFSNVSFASPAAVIAPTSAALKKLVCKKCGLGMVTFGDGNGLNILDLSYNDFTTVPSSLPATVMSLSLKGCKLAGPLEKLLGALPTNVQSIDVGYTHLTDILEGIKGVPHHVQHIDISGNPINTDVSLLLDALRPSSGFLQGILVKGCGLSGRLQRFQNMVALRTLDVSHNSLSSVRWAELPPRLEVLALSHNVFGGVLLVRNLPPSLKVLDVSHNKLEGRLNVADVPPNLETLDVSYNGFSGAIDLTQLPDSIRYVYVQFNRFQGTPNLVEIPVDLRRILIHDNDWDSLLPPL
ncbi:putative leucine-rich repeat protein [Trypanosoma grayi]|uniref:putative leucine-rich repeat protein n=1 Tax=Trypanosoma grayi TaxID=71804 RepID=UPI0004F43AEA|nr:putative leucine-rich repeat protein [Trypanosoma grayi]KEG13944.1 putative leucine-rich repeat protein [Trypanosoma grayi]